MRLKDQYDWVVLGDHPGALLNAALVAKQGLSVLILPLQSPLSELDLPAAPAEGSLQEDWVQAMEPSFWLGLRDSGLFAECLRSLGVSPETLAHEIDLSSDPIPQVVTPSLRLPMSLSADEMRFRWETEFGGSLDQTTGLLTAFSIAEEPIRQFWRDLPKRLTLTPEQSLKAKEGKYPRNSQKKAAETLRRQVQKTIALQSKNAKKWMAANERVGRLTSRLHPELELALSGLSAALLDLDQLQAKRLSAGGIIHLLALAKTGTTVKRGNRYLRKLLLDVAVGNGAHAPAKTDCRRIFVDSGRLVGVQTSTQGNMITVSGGVAGLPLQYAKDKMSFSGRNWRNRLKSFQEPQFWPFHIVVRINEAAIPKAMGNRLVWVEEGAPPVDLELIRGKNTVLVLRTLLPFRPETIEASYLQVMAARMYQKVSEILPFLSEHVKTVYPDFRKSPNDFEKELLVRTFETIPESMRVKSGSNIRMGSGVEGLFVSSAESYPELGSFGSIVSAVSAAAWIVHRNGRAGPL